MNSSFYKLVKVYVTTKDGNQIMNKNEIEDPGEKKDTKIPFKPF